MSKYWQSCPRCQSNKVQTTGKGVFFVLGIALIGFFWMGFFSRRCFYFLWLG